MQLVTSSDMRRIESAADAAGLSFPKMMLNAGSALADTVDDLLQGGSGRIVVLAGPGNNGGDGMVAAHLLADRGLDVRVLVWKRTAAADAMVAAALGPEAGAPFTLADAEDPEDLSALEGWLTEATIAVDALLGTGQSRPIEGRLAEILDCLRASVTTMDRPLVVAVDLPSGLDADTGNPDPHTVPADITVTFGFPKLGMFQFPGAGMVGELVIDDIGIPRELALLADTDLTISSAEEVALTLPEPRVDAHKGSFGRALMLVGSAAYPGAAALAAEAACRSGCGLVQLALPAPLVPSVAPRVPEAIYLPLRSTDAASVTESETDLVNAASSSDALLIGPGLSTDEDADRRVRTLLDAFSKQDDAGAAPTLPSNLETHDLDGHRPGIVIDADGLNLLPGLGGPERLPAGCVLTPHPGEMGRLIGRSPAEVQARRVDIARETSVAWDQVIVLKGALTVIAAPDGRTVLNPFANAALATAGSGDVLAGIITALMAQGLEAMDAAVCGAWIHGRAGELASDQRGTRGTLARDMVERLSDALFQLEDGTF